MLKQALDASKRSVPEFWTAIQPPTPGQEKRGRMRYSPASVQIEQARTYFAQGALAGLIFVCVLVYAAHSIPGMMCPTCDGKASLADKAKKGFAGGDAALRTKLAEAEDKLRSAEKEIAEAKRDANLKKKYLADANRELDAVRKDADLRRQLAWDSSEASLTACEDRKRELDVQISEIRREVTLCEGKRREALGQASEARRAADVCEARTNALVGKHSGDRRGSPSRVAPSRRAPGRESKFRACQSGFVSSVQLFVIVVFCSCTERRSSA